MLLFGSTQGENSHPVITHIVGIWKNTSLESTWEALYMIAETNSNLSTSNNF